MSIERKSDMNELLLVLGNVQLAQVEQLRNKLIRDGHTAIQVRHVDAVKLWGEFLNEAAEIFHQVLAENISPENGVVRFNLLAENFGVAQNISENLEEYLEFEIHHAPRNFVLQRCEDLIRVTGSTGVRLAIPYHNPGTEEVPEGSKTLAIIAGEEVVKKRVLLRVREAFQDATELANDEEEQPFTPPEIYWTPSPRFIYDFNAEASLSGFPVNF